MTTEHREESEAEYAAVDQAGAVTDEMKLCPRCLGDGWQSHGSVGGDGPKKCERCGGRGTVPASTLAPAPTKEFQVEVCNDCGGLVGWDNLRDGCCYGGVVCRRDTGTRFESVTLAGQ